MVRSARVFAVLALILAAAACAQKAPPVAAKETAPAAALAQASPALVTAESVAGLSVLEASACRSIENRSPVGVGEAFPPDVGRIYVFTKVGLDASREAKIKHVWRYNGREVAAITLPVKGPQWRTYSSKLIDPNHKGRWQVDVVNENDAALKSVSFKIE